MVASRARPRIRVLAATVVGCGLALGMFFVLARMIADGSRPIGRQRSALTTVRVPKPYKPKLATQPKRRSPVRVVTLARDPAPTPPIGPAVETLTGQVVETARPTVEERPDDPNAFLGRYDMKVDKQQKAKGRRNLNDPMGVAKLAEKSPIQSPQSKSLDPTLIPEPKRVVPPRDGKSEPTAEAAPARNDGLGPAPPPAPNVGPSSVGTRVVQGPESALLLPATSPGNVIHNLQALAGTGGSLDYIADIEDDGDTALLNTRKFRYWDFFQRVKEKVASEWEPARVWRSRDPTGVKYGVKDRLTVLRVTLDPDGALKRMLVQHRSGLEFLDEEAERAFSAAGPFPNPPNGLRNDRGEIEFQFGFMFEISTQRFKFQRITP
jgi:TonB family protein